jgi:hypothetical protein
MDRFSVETKKAPAFNWGFFANDFDGPVESITFDLKRKTQEFLGFAMKS